MIVCELERALYRLEQSFFGQQSTFFQIHAEREVPRLDLIIGQKTEPRLASCSPFAMPRRLEHQTRTMGLPGRPCRRTIYYLVTGRGGEISTANYNAHLRGSPVRTSTTRPRKFVRRHRLLQGTIFFRDGSARSSNQPSAWEHPLPDSVAEMEFKHVCRKTSSRKNDVR